MYSSVKRGEGGFIKEFEKSPKPLHSLLLMTIPFFRS